jgi:hypothetical protein
MMFFPLNVIGQQTIRAHCYFHHESRESARILPESRSGTQDSRGEHACLSRDSRSNAFRNARFQILSLGSGVHAHAKQRKHERRRKTGAAIGSVESTYPWLLDLSA